ncbi:MAG: glycosyltransferase family 4 protein [Planctomycetaceae bacterium]|nr:glycosyltransferase family 4 protein [Planctomycetaceae bacterium]MCA9120249.1 glycosyltransferase family 4 protein [Planctomycetales bacterium]MCB9927121.1 glycosyltransferase family 4 protein [Planctomycetaceae bacterium]
MNQLRLLMVTPRYWPLVGDTERVTSRLAHEFCARGCSTTILTARWNNDWPASVVHRHAIVKRLPGSPRGGWTTFRYMRALARWVREHQNDFDVVYVMNLRQDAYAIAGALRAIGPPVVLRAQRAGATGDCYWQEHARFGGRIRKRCHGAAAIVASTEIGVEELLRAGYSSIHQIEYGADEMEPRSAASRYHARVALADVNQDLEVAEFAPVAICVDRFTEGRGLAELIRAWFPIADRWPSAKLWLIGDGPLRDSLYEGIVDLGLRQQISMPGSFDELSELYHAADVFVSASTDFGTSQAMVEAMAAGLPIVASSTPDMRELMDDGVHGFLVPPDDRRRLSERISQMFESTELAFQLGLAARRRVRECLSLDRVVDDHLTLFHRLAHSTLRGTA